MTEADLEVLAGFDAVWERVLTGKQTAPASDAVPWAELLQGLHGLRRGYESLSRCALGVPKAWLCALSGETKALFDGLHTVYFLETGDIFLANEKCNFASYTPYNLRKLWKNATNLAGILQNAPNPAEASFKDAAETVYRQADRIKDLIQQALQ